MFARNAKSFALAFLFFNFLFSLLLLFLGKPTNVFFTVNFIIRHAGRCNQDRIAFTRQTSKCFRQGYFNWKISYVAFYVQI